MIKYMLERPMEKVGEIHCNWERLIQPAHLTYERLDTIPERGDNWFERYRHYGKELTGFERRFGDAIAAAVGGSDRWRWSLNKTIPPTYTKPHTDTFRRFLEKTGGTYVNPEQSRSQFLRFWIPMRDRQPGQFLECDGIPPLFDWKAGDVYVSPSHIPHYGATVGHDARYTFLMDGMNDDAHMAASSEYKIIHIDEKDYE